MNHDTHDYTHLELNREITAIGGHYTIRKEVRLAVDGREVLYLVAEALFDTTCCGFGGLTYAMVQGFLDQWHYRADAGGKPVSAVRPVTAAADQAKIQKIIQQRETVAQVNFI
ncbi:hypothetical protein [Desulfosudis oleivorans]|uniref:Uncharacterized protein n=1 Tax=Desulfosudis oleivorans (strain DSM 6200 / JCM 39069 / Hxd3) TaxID=96561 RepID=A8ZWK7_DESOH|nr:hypothetical protein [Desulfosudis oleivorans]ABW66815.1 hypothetical protein Dole_1005 [Desulfosudis oleivorans Hxd3]